jgi:hypothetical protein
VPHRRRRRGLWCLLGRLYQVRSGARTSRHACRARRVANGRPYTIQRGLRPTHPDRLPQSGKNSNPILIWAARRRGRKTKLSSASAAYDTRQKRIGIGRRTAAHRERRRDFLCPLLFRWRCLSESRGSREQPDRHHNRRKAQDIHWRLHCKLAVLASQILCHRGNTIFPVGTAVPGSHAEQDGKCFGHDNGNTKPAVDVSETARTHVRQWAIAGPSLFSSSLRDALPSRVAGLAQTHDRVENRRGDDGAQRAWCSIATGAGRRHDLVEAHNIDTDH